MNQQRRSYTDRETEVLEKMLHLAGQLGFCVRAAEITETISGIGMTQRIEFTETLRSQES